MNKLTGVVDSVQKIGNRTDIDECAITLDTFSTYTVFGEYNELITLIGKSVEFFTRKDVVNNIVTDVVTWIAERKTIQCISDDDSQLDFEFGKTLMSANSNKNAVIDFDSSTMKMNDVARSKIILVSHYIQRKSKIARWTDFQCLDCYSRSFQLRLFTNDDNVEEFCDNIKGKYVMVDIEKTLYGFQVSGEMGVYDQEVLTSPDVYTAALGCHIAIKNDELLKEYISKFDMIEELKKIVYFEPGFHLVEIKVELQLLNAICDISPSFNKDLIRRAIFCSRGYLIPSTKKVSNPLANYHRLIISPLKDDLDLLSILDISAGIEDGNVNKILFYEIKRMSSVIAKERRGSDEKNDINVALDSIDSKYSGVFRKWCV